MPTQKEQVFEIVKTMPGLGVSEIAQLVDFSTSSTSARLTELVGKGLIKREDGKYFLGEGKPIIPKKLQMKPEKVEKISLLDQIAKLEEELAVLHSWKQDAIHRYPDLAIKPEVLAARKIAIDYYESCHDKQKAHDISVGRFDDAPFMQMILAAMA